MYIDGNKIIDILDNDYKSIDINIIDYKIGSLGSIKTIKSDDQLYNINVIGQELDIKTLSDKFNDIKTNLLRYKKYFSMRSFELSTPLNIGVIVGIGIDGYGRITEVSHDILNNKTTMKGIM